MCTIPQSNEQAHIAEVSRRGALSCLGLCAVVAFASPILFGIQTAGAAGSGGGGPSGGGGSSSGGGGGGSGSGAPLICSQSRK